VKAVRPERQASRMPTPELHVGSKVRARFGATEHGAVGTKFFPGTVTKLYADGRVDIMYDDGDEEEGVDPKWIKDHQTPKGGAGARAESTGGKSKSPAEEAPKKRQRTGTSSASDASSPEGADADAARPSAVKAEPPKQVSAPRAAPPSPPPPAREPPAAVPPAALPLQAAPAAGRRAPPTLPVCEPGDQPGWYRITKHCVIASGQLDAPEPGAKFRAELPECRHKVTLTWPRQTPAPSVFKFKLAECSRCKSGR